MPPRLDNMIFLGLGVVIAVWGFYVAVKGPSLMRRLIRDGKLEDSAGRIGAARMVGWGMVIFGLLMVILNAVALWAPEEVAGV